MVQQHARAHPGPVYILHPRAGSTKGLAVARTTQTRTSSGRRSLSRCCRAAARLPHPISTSSPHDEGMTERTPSMYDVVKAEHDVRAILLSREVVGEERVAVIDEQSYLLPEPVCVQQRPHGIVALVLVGCFLQRRLALLAMHALRLTSSVPPNRDGLSVS